MDNWRLIFEKGFYRIYFNTHDYKLKGKYKGEDISHFEDYLDDYEDLFNPPNCIELDWTDNKDLPIDPRMIDYCKELTRAIDQEFKRDHARLTEELGYDPNRDPMQDYWDHESDKIAIHQEFHDNETS